MIRNGGQSVLEFKYNADGIRTSKIVNNVEHIYTLNGSQIVSEAWGDILLIYLYDESGSPIGMQYRKSSYAADVFDTFYFEKNLHGDIIAIYTESGRKILEYTYDAWGNHSVTWTYLMMETLPAVFNPFRYRGYYYDTETQLYYLQSRYYNPATGRFINADGYISTGTGLIGHNMYAYCNNNPVMYTDESGYIAVSVLVASIVIGVSAITGATISGITSYRSGNSGLEIAKDVAVGFGVGSAIGGAAVCLSGMTLGLVGVLTVQTAAQVFAVGALGVDFLMFIVMPLATGEQGQGIELSPINTPTPQLPSARTTHPSMK